MRADLDTVLNEIGATCLTGAEYALAASVMNGKMTDADKYRALNAVLIKRGGCAAELQALHAHFAALGCSLADLEPQPGESNIFIGAPL
ncbi:hypothetical protein [Candidatus Avelusimicrobium fimicolum]|uniref:hypothetical protein n=1 Tax=Candidatus Avelusimicrobium fimicolum TaxID=3416216 RepID=UPI003D0C74D0